MQQKCHKETNDSQPMNTSYKVNTGSILEMSHHEQFI